MKEEQILESGKFSLETRLFLNHNYEVTDVVLREELTAKEEIGIFRKLKTDYFYRNTGKQIRYLKVVTKNTDLYNSKATFLFVVNCENYKIITSPENKDEFIESLNGCDLSHFDYSVTPYFFTITFFGQRKSNDTGEFNSRIVFRKEYSDEVLLFLQDEELEQTEQIIGPISYLFK